MAKISSYPHTVPTAGDSILISKSSNKTTRSTTVGDVIDLIETGLLPGVGTVTSIGVTVPSAFTVTNSPVTSTGVINITGSGTSTQYIDGTGSLQDSANQALDTTSNVTFSTITGDGAAITNIDKYTTAQVDGFLALKADQATTYTKTEADTLLALKADQATTYTKTEADSLFTSGFVGAITPTSTAPTQDGLYSCSTSGTYTNFGGEVVSLNNQVVSIAVENNQTTFTQIITPTGIIFDSVPTAGSTNAVTSEGIFDKSRFDSVQPFIIDAASTSSCNISMTVDGSNIKFEWDSVILLQNYFGQSDFVIYLSSSSQSGLKSFSIGAREAAYIKKSDMVALGNGGVIQPTITTRQDNILNDADVIILAIRNDSEKPHFVNGLIADFAKNRLSTQERFQIVDNTSIDDLGLTIQEGSPSADDITISWTGEILVGSLDNTSNFKWIVSENGTKTITLTKELSVCYFKRNEISGTGGNLTVYFSQWRDSLLEDVDNIVLIGKNKSPFLKDCNGILGEFLNNNNFDKEINNIDIRVTALESLSSTNVKTLAAYDRGLAQKEYTTTKKFGIIAAGQSNIDGRVSRSTDPPSWYLSEGSPSQITNAKHWNNTAKSWSSWNIPSEWAFDTEVYHALTNYLSDDIYIVKHSLGSTAISETVDSTGSCWQPFFELTNPTATNLTEEFEQYITEAMASSEFSNVEIKAFLWHQGERDAFGGTVSQNAYYQNFQNLIAYVRGVVGNPILPIVFGTISESSSRYNTTINTAQNQIASEDPFAFVVDMSQATLFDTLHFDGTSSESLGQSMFNIIKDF